MTHSFSTGPSDDHISDNSIDGKNFSESIGARLTDPILIGELSYWPHWMREIGFPSCPVAFILVTNSGDLILEKIESKIADVLKLSELRSLLFEVTKRNVELTGQVGLILQEIAANITDISRVDELRELLLVAMQQEFDFKVSDASDIIRKTDPVLNSLLVEFQNELIHFAKGGEGLTKHGGVAIKVRPYITDDQVIITESEVAALDYTASLFSLGLASYQHYANTR